MKANHSAKSNHRKGEAEREREADEHADGRAERKRGEHEATGGACVLTSERDIRSVRRGRW